MSCLAQMLIILPGTLNATNYLHTNNRRGPERTRQIASSGMILHNENSKRCGRASLRPRALQEGFITREQFIQYFSGEREGMVLSRHLPPAVLLQQNTPWAVDSSNRALESAVRTAARAGVRKNASF